MSWPSSSRCCVLFLRFAVTMSGSKAPCFVDISHGAWTACGCRTLNGVSERPLYSLFSVPSAASYTVQAAWHEAACMGHSSFFHQLQCLPAGLGLACFCCGP